MARRVVVTGLGTVNPLGNSVEEFWRRVKNVENGIGPVTRFDASDFSSRVVGEIKDFDPGEYLDKREARRMDAFTTYAVAAAQQALMDSGLQGALDPERAGVILGNGIGGFKTLGDNFK